MSKNLEFSIDPPGRKNDSDDDNEDNDNDDYD